MKPVPITGSPPMPMQVDWPRSLAGELMDYLIGQGAGAGDHPDGSGVVDGAGHDSDLAQARGNEPGQLGPISRQDGCPEPGIF